MSLTLDMVEETVKISLEKRINHVILLMYKRLANQNGEGKDAGLSNLRRHSVTKFQQIFHFQKQSLRWYFDMQRQFC